MRAVQLVDHAGRARPRAVCAAAVLLLLATAACSGDGAGDPATGSADAAVSSHDAQTADAAPADPRPDASASCAPDACGPLGCCGATCCELSPANADLFGPLTETGRIAGPPAGTFDTAADCHAQSVLGVCEIAPVADAPDVCVCRADEVVIDTLTVTGPHALAILAWRSVEITGDVVLDAGEGRPGPGAVAAHGGGAMGVQGGRGGSHATRGGNGGVDPYGSPGLEPLLGGLPGMDGCSSRPGGGGGGALQITAGETVIVTGRISAGGGGGAGGSGSGTCLGGAGGGSGGAVLLEAPRVEVPGAVAANGGGGGGGGSNEGEYGGPGAAGAPAGTPSAGGTGRDGNGCPLYGYTSGGDGGQGSVAAGEGQPGQPSDSVSGCIGGTDRLGEGGGGGGAGRIRVNTDGGCLCTGVFSPPPSMGEIRTE